MALDLMAYGAVLIGDDRVALDIRPDLIFLRPPPRIAGRIEARGVGVLAAETTSAPLAAIVDLDAVEPDRLPAARTMQLETHAVPLFHKVESPHFAPALWQYLKGERSDD